MTKPNPPENPMRYLMLITQFGISMVAPLVLCLWFASYLKEKYLLGNWVMLLAVVIGLAGGVSGFISLFHVVKKPGGNTGKLSEKSDHASSEDLERKRFQ